MPLTVCALSKFGTTILRTHTIRPHTQYHVLICSTTNIQTLYPHNSVEGYNPVSTQCCTTFPSQESGSSLRAFPNSSWVYESTGILFLTFHNEYSMYNRSQQGLWNISNNWVIISGNRHCCWIFQMFFIFLALWASQVKCHVLPLYSSNSAADISICL